MAKKKLPTPNPYRRYSVEGLDAATKAARRPSRACIRHHVEEAAKRRADALAALASKARRARASTMSLQMWQEAATVSLHILARKALEYHRMRAFAVSSGGGSYAPRGWPLDRHARDQWAALNPQAFSEAA
ncbi:hypothetical protein CcrRB23_gp518 [Caulobacter phage RB23]|nr:hypothetical protein CcrRB23_gp023 [Caulobacter phage RB23]UTU10380.1 hypothetical protein CcrRB23_gp518 [Caulobacter phage RB23]